MLHDKHDLIGAFVLDKGVNRGLVVDVLPPDNEGGTYVAMIIDDGYIVTAVAVAALMSEARWKIVRP